MFITTEDAFDPEEMLNLYDSFGWEGYTSDVDRFCPGLANSHLVITARDGSRGEGDRGLRAAQESPRPACRDALNTTCAKINRRSAH
ncbi:hypothetical protein [Streptomyces sp. NPDC056169]|uniref:hypothetical protein n=1 Tax=Streptomyces sp. NPDC056169 TaxID=3345734 RepID=UPI0035D79216